LCAGVEKLSDSLDLPIFFKEEFVLVGITLPSAPHIILATYRPRPFGPAL
jgi:hypothetical protein